MFLDFFDVFLILFDSFGIFWNLLESSRIFLDSFDVFLILFDSFGIFWNLLESFGIFWNLLVSFGIFWILLDYFWYFWILLDSFWNLLDFLEFFRIIWNKRSWSSLIGQGFEFLWVSQNAELNSLEFRGVSYKIFKSSWSSFGTLELKSLKSCYSYIQTF